MLRKYMYLLYLDTEDVSGCTLSLSERKVILVSL